MSDGKSTRHRAGSSEARRQKAIAALLTKMARDGLCLVPGEGRDSSFALQARKGMYARRLATLEADLVGAVLNMDLLERAEGGVLVLSSAGRAWLRRRLSPAEPFRRQHGQIEPRPLLVDGAIEMLQVNVSESPLAWLRLRKGRDGTPLIDDHQFAAGERLRSDFTRARLTPSVTANWSPVADRPKRRSGERGGAADLIDSVIAARTRVERALAAVGPELGDVLLDVCCFLKGLEQAEREQDWPARSGKLILQLALTRLARHYGLASTPAHGLPRRMRHWGAEDYRPAVTAGE
jgi:hypothetical protein